MTLTERQKQILINIVREYIDAARPVSSELLEKKYHMDLSSPMIRIEMQRLTDMDYISQKHTSAGRIPTDKGYRFFVAQVGDLATKNKQDIERNPLFKNIEQMAVKARGYFKIAQAITKELAFGSSNLGVCYISDEDILWKEGWSGVFHNPEFNEPDFAESFFAALEGFEENIDSIREELLKNSEIKVLIGQEAPYLGTEDVSLIISESKFPDKKDGMLAILGPKRMAYDTNIALMNSLIDSLNRVSV